MAQKSRNIEIVSTSFLVLYIVILGQLILFFANLHKPVHMAISAILLFLLAVSIYGINRMRVWGRMLFLSLAVIFCLYFGFLHARYPDAVHKGYLIVNIIVLLFFFQQRIRFRFRKDWSSVRKCILVIDDDDGLQKTIQRILLPKGFSVLTATTGEKGLQVAKTQKPDLILLDVILPGIKGREVCSILKEEETTKEIPVVFLTAKDSPDDIDAEMAAGAVSHLTKPVNSKVLVAEIKKILS